MEGFFLLNIYFYARLQFTHDIDKEALTIKIQIGQIIREIGKVITTTHFYILTKVPVQCSQHTFAFILCFFYNQRTTFY